MTPDNHVISIHAVKIVATGDLRAAMIVLDGPLIGQTFFTDPKSPKGDALERAISHARANDPEAMRIVAENQGTPVAVDFDGTIQSIEKLTTKKPKAKKAAKKE